MKSIWLFIIRQSWIGFSQRGVASSAPSHQQHLTAHEPAFPAAFSLLRWSKRRRPEEKTAPYRENVGLISILRTETQRPLCLGNKSHNIQRDLHIQSIKPVIRTGTKVRYFHTSTGIDTLILPGRQRLIGCSCLRVEYTSHFERSVTTNPP